MRKHAVAASAAAVLLGISGVCAGSAANATPTGAPVPTDAPRTPKTLVIGVDGASFDVLEQAETPSIHALQQGGLTATSNLPASPMAPTVSGAGWSTIATGVWPDKHRVTDNNFTNPNYAQFPDYLTRIEQAAPQRSTFVVGTWGPISTTVFGSAVDERVQGKNDADTTAKAVERLSTGNPDDVFVHLDEVDGAGHSTGSSSAAYRAALKTADQQIAKIVGAVEQRPDYANEDWLIVVTADHGHTPTGGHGGASRLERKTFVIAKGAEFAAGSTRDDVRIADIAPTVLAHDGIARKTDWELDGEAVNDIVPDDFDALRPKLRGAVDEKGLVGITGWTNEAPEGWTVDNSKMPTGGSTEFRGWTFMTDDFFSNAELGQHRENNVRSRNVFAVADSDEWDDVSPKSSRNFDSTLVTPEYPLNGAATVDISFVSDYAVDDPQGAGVRVSFDEASGLQPQKLVDYPANGTRANPVNQVEHFSYELPRDAKGRLPKSIRLNFSYSGINSAFWAIDQVRVSQP
ncbi:nucleotide pyrophosphatase, partial [Leucobacter sp. OLES1]